MSDTPTPQRRGGGIGRVFLRGNTWWFAFYHRGKEHRESSHSDSETVARRRLRERVKEIGNRGLVPNEARLTFDNLVTDILNDYQINARRSLDTVKALMPHLRGFFGMDRVIDITLAQGRAYQMQRLNEGAANGTVNREMSVLGKMLSLAVESGRLSARPKFKMLQENNARQGFLEHQNFQAILAGLPVEIKPLIEFLYLSGWRLGEALNLQWRDVDTEARSVRVRIENSKNSEPRVLPLTTRLWGIMEGQLAIRRLDCPHVFHRAGRPIRDFRRSWITACIAAGLGKMEPRGGRMVYTGTLVHDLRRCAARNLSRAGVPESVAMKITGHKTASMYRRYRIINDNDQREALERMQAHLDTPPLGAVVTPIGHKKASGEG